MGARRRGRDRAAQVLYQWALTRRAPDRLLDLFWRAHEEPDEVRAFAEKLARGTIDGVEHIDRLIDHQASNWRPERMSIVDRSILRLGTYELLNEPDTPPAVILNEAIDLAKKYSGPEAGQFVNGILDGIRKRLDAPGTTTAAVSPPDETQGT